MAIQSISTLKSYFSAGKFPNQSNYEDLIDTLVASGTQTDSEEFILVNEDYEDSQFCIELGLEGDESDYTHVFPVSDLITALFKKTYGYNQSDYLAKLNACNKVTILNYGFFGSSNVPGESDHPITISITIPGGSSESYLVTLYSSTSITLIRKAGKYWIPDTSNIDEDPVKTIVIDSSNIDDFGLNSTGSGSSVYNVYDKLYLDTILDRKSITPEVGMRVVVINSDALSTKSQTESDIYVDSYTSDNIVIPNYGAAMFVCTGSYQSSGTRYYWSPVGVATTITDYELSQKQQESENGSESYGS